MRLLSTAIAATVVLALAVPAFAADKPDRDALLKQIFHGKPGAVLTAHPIPWLFPWTKPATK